MIYKRSKSYRKSHQPGYSTRPNICLKKVLSNWRVLGLRGCNANSRSLATTRVSRLRAWGPGIIECIGWLLQMRFCSRCPNRRTVLQDWQNKTPKTSPDQVHISKYTPSPAHYTKFLSSRSCCSSQMRLKSELAININTKDSKHLHIGQHSTIKKQRREARKDSQWVWDHRCFGLSSIHQHSPPHTPLTNTGKITIQRFTHVHSLSRWWNSCQQNRIVSICDPGVLYWYIPET